jgi:DNA-binding transcriptional LysR family regulator
VDFALAIDPPDSDDLVMQTVLHDPFHLVCRNDDPLAALDQVPWRALDDRALVLLDHGSGSRRLIDDLLAHHGVHARVVQQAAHTYTVFRMVEASLGISITPGLSLPLPADASLVVRPLLPRAERAIRLVRRHQPALSPSARLAWERLQALAAPLAAEEAAAP